MSGLLSGGKDVVWAGQ